MTGETRPPSKWWFWGPVVLGNAYLALGFTLPAFWQPRGFVLDVLQVLYLPVRILLAIFLEPLVASLHIRGPEEVLAILALSETAVLLVGGLVYGAAAALSSRNAMKARPGDEVDR